MSDRFERIALLSKAASYMVWDAWDHERFARVILKEPLPEKRERPTTRERLMREGKLLRSLSHPHVVPAHELLTEPHPMLVMESLGGATLSHMIETGPPLDDHEIAFLGLQLISALSYLHRQGYLHLDLKPSNVISEAGRARLIDLGLATPPGPIEAELGTWSYMSPEQARGDRIDAAADVWGLGATLFDCATGFPPFNDPELDDEAEYPQLHRRARAAGSASQGYRAASEHRLSADLAALIDSLLEPEPAQRPQLAAIAEALEKIADMDVAERRLSRNLRAGARLEMATGSEASPGVEMRT